MRSREEEAIDLLSALGSLSEPDPKTLWGTPLVRTVAILEQLPRGGVPGGGLAVRIHVYATRLLFYLIAHPSLRLAMSYLSPAGACLPVTPLPKEPAVFLSHGGASCAPFSLEGVLKTCENGGHREVPQPAGLALQLKRYQLHGLSWMQDMEDASLLPRGVNGIFWEERQFADGGRYR